MPQRMVVTVAELAHWLRLDPAEVKDAAGARSLQRTLSTADLDEVLEQLRARRKGRPGRWDLSPLDELDGSWVDGLRELYALPVTFPASMPPSQGLQIREIVQREQPRRAAEVGCFVGISSHWIASALPAGAELHSVDTFWPKYPSRFHYAYLADPMAAATSAARSSGLDSAITFHRADSAKFARRLPQEPAFDFVFLDGDHTYGGVTRDFLAWFPLVKPGGCLLLHDTNPALCEWDGPRRLIDEVLVPSPHVEVVEITTEPDFGMALVRKLDAAPGGLDVPAAARVEQVRNRSASWARNSAVGGWTLRRVVKPAVVWAGSRR